MHVYFAGSQKMPLFLLTEPVQQTLIILHTPAIGATVVAQPAVEYPLQVKLTESDVTTKVGYDVIKA